MPIEERLADLQVALALGYLLLVTCAVLYAEWEWAIKHKRRMFRRLNEED